MAQRAGLLVRMAAKQNWNEGGWESIERSVDALGYLRTDRTVVTAFAVHTDIPSPHNVTKTLCYRPPSADPRNRFIKPQRPSASGRGTLNGLGNVLPAVENHGPAMDAIANEPSKSCQPTCTRLPFGWAVTAQSSVRYHSSTIRWLRERERRRLKKPRTTLEVRGNCKHNPTAVRGALFRSTPGTPR